MATTQTWFAAWTLWALGSACTPQPSQAPAPSHEARSAASALSPAASPQDTLRIQHTVKDLQGQDFDLAHLRGSVLLIVNTASQCGLTPQYEGLQSLYETYRARGLQVLAFPANDFKAQEPLDNAAIGKFVKETYGVTFPVFAKVTVAGPDKEPLYKDLIEASPEAFRGELKWNFTKFLIGRDGRVIGRFEPRTDPLAPQVVEAIEKALAEPAP